MIDLNKVKNESKVVFIEEIENLIDDIWEIAVTCGLPKNKKTAKRLSLAFQAHTFKRAKKEMLVELFGEIKTKSLLKKHGSLKITDAEETFGLLFCAIDIFKSEVEKKEAISLEDMNLLMSISRFGWRVLSTGNYSLDTPAVKVLLAGLASKRGRRAAEVRHIETYEIKKRCFKWFDENAKNYKSMDEAAIALTKVEPIKFSTARRTYMPEWKKHSASRLILPTSKA